MVSYIKEVAKMDAEIYRLRAEEIIANPFHIGAERFEISGRHDLHWHDYFTLDLILRGRGEHHINGRCERIEQGMVQLIYPTDIHKIESDESVELISVRFTEQALAPRFFNIIYGKSIRNLYPEKRIFERICGCADAMLEELGSPQKPFSKELLDLSFREIILLTAREAGEEDNFVRSSAERTILYINEHFRENISLEQAAEYAGFSAPYFSAYFKNKTGKTYSEYVTGLKINYACGLLRDTDYSIAEICFSSGFGSISNFNSIFRKKSGMSPSKFREKN